MLDRQQITILIVDDMQENVNLLSRILMSRNFKVQTANSGIKALQYVQETPPNLILMDIHMPFMDGLETCARLKEDEHCRDIPVIFISALYDVDTKLKAFQAGGVDYISKPFEVEEVVARVETHLSLQDLRQQLEYANRQLATQLDELTHSQALLRERESKLRAFVNALPHLSFIFDEEGRFLEILTRDTDLLPADAETLQGNKVSDVIPPKAAKVMLSAIQSTIKTGKTAVVEYITPVQTGGERWFEGRTALMEKGEAGHSKVVFVAIDISERVRLYQQVEQLANLDTLTNCFNRRYFMSLLETEIQRSIRHQRPLSLLMLDIDHFKKFNDQYGHQIGDQLLCALVDLCRKYSRTDDIMGRYGGEEFVILMPETDEQGGLNAAERLRQRIEKMQIETARGKLSVTVSMGLAALQPNSSPTQTIDMLIQRADQALYAAKADGRNCVRLG